jgi:hypothetical protein
MQQISYFNFNRKRCLKLIRSKFDLNIITCKLFKTKNDKLAKLNYERILNTISRTIQKQITFSSNNIYYIYQLIDNHNKFISEFSESIKTLNSTDTLKDIQIAFFTKQAEFEKLLKENLEKPYYIDLNNISVSE